MLRSELQITPTFETSIFCPNERPQFRRVTNTYQNSWFSCLLGAIGSAAVVVLSLLLLLLLELLEFYVLSIHSTMSMGQYT
ncbi:hypothetical protein HZH68_009165 [Vespula germanica]|uniref:Uncharacterized protein n=1 Tax=Vespula germanica TaxID=30212 RepID=A0A834K0D8_VESGE|nr:hypothetical protein HZH68_009165 [Vespula germanica]